jgi:hypothetical protein
VNLEVVLKKPAGWKMTRPWEASLVPHGKGSRLRGSRIGAPKGNARCGSHNGAMFPKCKGKKFSEQV